VVFERSENVLTGQHEQFRISDRPHISRTPTGNITIVDYSDYSAGFYPGTLWGELPPQTLEIPPRSIGQVYSSIKNPVIAVIKRAAVTQV